MLTPDGPLINRADTADTGLSGSETPSTTGKKLNKAQYHLLLYYEQSFWRTGRLPDYEAVKAAAPKFSREDYDDAWANPRFVAALASRGLPEHALVNPNQNQSSQGSQVSPFMGTLLTEKQMQVANVLLDTMDKRSRLKKLTELGVSTGEYARWLKDPVYRRYCLERAEALLIENQYVAHMSLIDNVANGDLGAIKYFNSMTGRFRERAAAGVEVNIQNNFGQDILFSIVEIIQRHVRDPEVLNLIGEELLALVGNTNNNSTGGLPTSPVGHLNSNLGISDYLPAFHDPKVINGSKETL